MNIVKALAEFRVVQGRNYVGDFEKIMKQIDKTKEEEREKTISTKHITGKNTKYNILRAISYVIQENALCLQCTVRINTMYSMLNYAVQHIRT
ncbi:MAG: hypothetical protein LBV47_00260 [Bacteroidales bacterium]|jgi:uncharacterized protein (DUF2225 family)|nr:hypothetical protein [Bacteroidales bacterium]